MSSALNTTASRYLGGIEAGGTKFNCVVGTADGEILKSVVIPTTRPRETLAKVLAFFEQEGPIQRLGIASFGPLDRDQSSPLYGQILHTPKLGWGQFNLVDFFRRHLQVPVTIDTDVNGAALGEHHFGAARGLKHFVYITVGTGLGGGVMIDGQLLQGVGHPELGHMLIPHDPVSDPFAGCCPFHDNCLEGLASGTAMTQRWQAPIADLPREHPAWRMEAHYLAMMCVNLTHCYMPQKIILGGGVMSQRQLFPMIHAEFSQLLNGYARAQVLTDAESYIVPSGCAGYAGQLGALILAAMH